MTYDKPKRYGAGALTAPPDGVYSYATCILTHLDDGTLVYNDTRYSPTTGKHQGQVRLQYIPGTPTWTGKKKQQTPSWPGVIVVDDVPRGCGAAGLRALAAVAGVIA